MARKKLSRNAPCPCGSGKKYKHCCYGKGFDYEQDADGKLFKSIPMSDEMLGLVEEQRQKFIQKYGREPGPGDKVFFDMPHPEQVEHMTVQAMKAAGRPGKTRGAWNPGGQTRMGVSQGARRLEIRNAPSRTRATRQGRRTYM